MFAHHSKSKEASPIFTLDHVRNTLNEAKRTCQYIKESDLFIAAAEAEIQKLLSASSNLTASDDEQQNKFKQAVADFTLQTIEAMKNRQQLAKLTFDAFISSVSYIFLESISVAQQDKNPSLTKIFNKHPSLARLADEVMKDFNIYRDGFDGRMEIAPKILQLRQQASDIMSRCPRQQEAQNTTTPSMRMGSK